MRSGIDWIQLNGGLRKLKRRFCLAEIPLQARMYEMFNVIHLHKAAVTRRESRIFTDGTAKDGDRPLPAIGVEFRHEILPAKPAVVNVQRNVGLSRKPHQAFRR